MSLIASEDRNHIGGDSHNGNGDDYNRDASRPAREPSGPSHWSSSRVVTPIAPAAITAPTTNCCLFKQMSLESAAWPRGQTPVLRNFGTVFDSPRGRRNIFLCQLLLVLLATLKALAPLGAGVSLITPLPERLPGLIEGSLRPQSSFEYMCLVVNSL